MNCCQILRLIRLVIFVEVSRTGMRYQAKLLTFTHGEGTPIHYLYGYEPPNGVVVLKLLI